MVSIPKWVEPFFAPKLNEITGEIKALGIKIDSTNERIDSLRNEMKSEIARLDGKIDALSQKVDVVRDLERLKIEVQALKR